MLRSLQSHSDKPEYIPAGFQLLLLSSEKTCQSCVCQRVVYIHQIPWQNSPLFHSKLSGPSRLLQEMQRFVPTVNMKTCKGRYLGLRNLVNGENTSIAKVSTLQSQREKGGYVPARPLSLAGPASSQHCAMMRLFLRRFEEFPGLSDGQGILLVFSHLRSRSPRSRT